MTETAAGPCVTRLGPADRPRWAELWQGYLAFYNTTLPDRVYDATWARISAADGAGRGVHGLGLRLDGSRAPLAGIAHYLFHEHGWSEQPACYLQDLFVDPAVRGHGHGRRLIEAVAAAAVTQGCARYYWMTQADNATARRLYDRVARWNGFIRYDYPLPAASPPG